jgi:uncharacterized protein (DUF1800 family)
VPSIGPFLAHTGHAEFAPPSSNALKPSSITFISENALALKANAQRNTVILLISSPVELKS